MDDALCRAEAGPVALLPAGSARMHRLFEEILFLERHDHVELDTARQQRLGGDDVGPAGERAVSEADLFFVQHRVDGRPDPGLVCPVRAEHMPAIMEHARRPERRDQGGTVVHAHPQMGADHAELAQGRGAAAEIGAAPDRLAGQDPGHLVGAAEQEQGLGLRGRLVIIGGRSDLRIRQQGLGQRPRIRVATGEQGEGRRVDPGKAVLRRLIDVVIGLERPLHRFLPRRAGGHVEGAVLEDPRADRALVDIARAFEPVFGEFRHRPVGVAHAGERQDLLVSDGAAVVARLDRSDGGVIGADQVAARQGLPGDLGGFDHPGPYGC